MSKCLWKPIAGAKVTPVPKFTGQRWGHHANGVSGLAAPAPTGTVAFRHISANLSANVALRISIDAVRTRRWPARSW